MSGGIFRNSEKSVVLGFQGTALKFSKLYIFLVVSIILPAHPCQRTAFFAYNSSSNPYELLGLYLPGEVRWCSPRRYKSPQVLKLLKLRVLCKQGTTFNRLSTGKELAFAPLPSCVHGKENQGPEEGQVGSCEEPCQCDHSSIQNLELWPHTPRGKEHEENSHDFTYSLSGYTDRC